MKRVTLTAFLVLSVVVLSAWYGKCMAGIVWVDTYVILDGYGGIHGWTFLEQRGETSYFPYFGWDIARDFEFLSETSGLLLDGYGGVHKLGLTDINLDVMNHPYFGWNPYIGTERNLSRS